MGNATIRISALVGAALAVSSPAFAQSSPPMSVCNTQPQAAACTAVRGDRADGWAAQSRAEVMASHGIVTTSQPLAAQAGLQILMKGGNAIDAAVASAAVLNLVEPMNTGVGGDLFAIIYIAKEKKLYALNASGMAPSGATLERFNALGYQADPENWGPGSGMPRYGILTVTVPGTVWGWDEVLRRFGTQDLQGGAGSLPSTMPRTASRSRSASATTGVCPTRCRCSGAAPSSIRIRSRPGTSTASARSRDRSTAIPISRGPSGSCRRVAATPSTKARSRAPSSPSRRRSAAP